MPDISELSREPIITDRQRRQEAADRTAREDFDSGIAAALQHTPVADFVNAFYRTGFDPDPDFRWDRKLVDEFADGIDTDLIPQFADAVSMEHAQTIRAQLLIKSDHRRALSNLGWKGQALSVAANVIDPVTLAVGVATGGVGHLAAVGAATRTARMIRMGVITGGGFAGLEAARAGVNPEIGAVDILASGLGGAGFGIGSELTHSMGRTARALAIGAGGAVGPAGVDLIGNQFRDEEERRSVLWNGATNFMLGGILSLVAPGQRRAMQTANPELFRASEKISESGRRMQRDVEHATAKDDGATITPNGERYFKEQIADPVARSEPLVRTADENVADADALLARVREAENVRTLAVREEFGTRMRREAEIHQIKDSFARAEKRLTQFSPDKRLNRSEVDAVLDGTPYTAGNQGFPSISEMRGYLGKLHDEAVLAADAEHAPRLIEAAESLRAATEARAAAEVVGVSRTEVPPTTDAAVNTQAAIEAALAKGKELQNFTGPAMGAASPEIGVEPQRPAMQVGDMDFVNATSAAPTRPKLLGVTLPRLDPAATVGKSPLVRFRKAINIFAKDPLPKSDGTPSVYSAPEQVHDRTVSMRGRLLARLDAAYAEHRKAQGEIALDRETFNEQATRAWRRSNQPGMELDPAAQHAAKVAGDLVGEAHAFAKRHQVPGFENFDHKADYVPTLWRQDLIDQAVTMFGHDQLVSKLLAPAILAGEWNLTAEQAVQMAKAILKNGGRKMSPSELERGRLFADNPERLAEILRDANPEMPDSQVAAIVGEVMPRRETAGTPTRARQRISMDRTFAADLVDPKTGETVRANVEALMENNIESLVSKYAHQLYGASALHAGFRALYPERPPTSIDGVIERLRKEAGELGEKNIDADLKRLETVMKITGGIPLYEDNATRQVLRTITNMNYVRTMSNAGTGLQNFAEINQAMNELGMVNVARHLKPAIGIFKRAEDGTMTTPMLRELEAIGIGLDRVVNRVTPRMLGEEGLLAATGKAEYWSAKTAKLSSDVSLQSFGQVTMEAAIGPAVMQKFADIARGGRPMGEFRQLAAGLDDSMAERVQGQIREHADFKQDGTSLCDLRVEDWADVEAASAFRGAVSKITKRLALRVNPTELARWMHSDVGKLAIFLRKFLIGSYTNKTLFEYQARDGIAAKNVVVGLLATGLAYTARTYINSIGRPDADEYRRKMLSMERITTAAIGRAPFSSFIPAAVDTVMRPIGRPEVFSHARTSGMSASLILGNPMVDWGLGVYNGYPPRAFIGPLWSDYDFSRQDLEGIAKGFWIPNVVGARAVLEQIGVDLPATSENP